jgi:hypothetical protein
VFRFCTILHFFKIGHEETVNLNSDISSVCTKSYEFPGAFSFCVHTSVAHMSEGSANTQRPGN